MTDSGLVSLATLTPERAGLVATGISGGDVPGVIGRTSGSTGAPRELILPASAIAHAARATNSVLGAGRWLAALPPVSIGGFMVWARAAVSGSIPVDLAGAALTGSELVRQVDAAGGPVLVSLVPTQLRRIVDGLTGTEDLSGVTVLLGGAASDPALVAAARGAGARVVRSYGMTETCGGCVLDGRAVDGVQVRATDDGRLLIAGPVLTSGYVGGAGLADESLFLSDDDGTTWLRTNDLGSVVDGVVTVSGRADDVIVSGGLNIAPAPVEAAIAALPGVIEVCVVGVPDTQWGESAAAALVMEPGAELPDHAAVRAAAVAATGDRRMAPRSLVAVDALPRIGPGKVNRREVQARVVESLHANAPAEAAQE